ncbi:DUF1385 domain-containing protein [Acidaminobacterium chupaoyuni]
MTNRQEQYKTTIGGQALIEGILMRGPQKTSIVVRNQQGELINKIEEVGTAVKNPVARLPLARGVVNFWNSMKFGLAALTYSADFFAESDEEPSRFEKWLERKLGAQKLDKLMMGFALMMGILLPVGLFILLPTLLAGFFVSETSSVVARNLLEGGVRIFIFLAFIIITSKQSDIKRTYMYHGAEHKTIACYESGEELTVENVRRHSRFHPRCGTSFLFVVMIISILVFSVVSWTNPWMRMVMRLVLLPVVVGISYEINRWVGRHDNGFSKMLRAPGLFLQRFTTYEPDDGMIEVGIEALKSVIPENIGEDRW